MKRHSVILCVLVALLGCTGDSHTRENESRAREDDSRAREDDSRTWKPVWKQANPLSVTRQGLAAVEVNGVIYAMGGAIGTNFLKSTEYARIQSDGSLGPWKPGPPMNEARGYFDAEYQDGYIYVIGGGNGPSGQVLLRTVERSRIREDGTLSPWVTETQAMVMPRRCSKTVLIDGTIYAIGGFSGDMLNSVEHTKILAGGGTDEWFEEPERLTVMRYISGVKSVDGIVYVAGSHDQLGGASLRDVEWSKVLDEAGFGKWQKTSPMVVERYGQGLAVHGGRLYAVGGLNGPEFLDSIEAAPIKPGGGLGPWRMYESKLASRRAMMAMLTYEDWVYSIGGAGTNLVEYATFNEDGEIGSWLTPEEAAAIEKRRAQIRAQAQFPLGGRVAKTMHAAPYVYILVQPQGRQAEWVAGPTGDYKVGDLVRYGRGAIMSDFYSKQLGIHFDNVRFIHEIRKEE